MEQLTNILSAIRDAVWGVPTMILLLGTGLLLTVRLKGMTLDQMKAVPWVSNASVTVVRVEDGIWHLEEIGADAHLSQLKTQFPANV